MAGMNGTGSPWTFRSFRKGCNKSQKVGIKVGAQKTPSKMVGIIQCYWAIAQWPQLKQAANVLTKGVNLGGPWAEVRSTDFALA